LKGLVTEEVILKLRRTGGFNNDTDTSYAITLTVLANRQKTATQARKFLSSVAKNADETGIISVEKFLSSCSYDVQKLKKMLYYPGPVGLSMLATVFDELFYGPKLFKKKHKFEPKYYFGKPLIENDRLMVTRTTTEALLKRFNDNIAVVSGRSKFAAEYSLKPILDTFNQRACVYLEDEKREYGKPNPYALKRAMRVMDANTAICAGDSTEDLLMARRMEKETGVKIAFVGIYGCSKEPAGTVRQFRENGADAIIESINQLPYILNNVSAKM
jgi:phosphoglycolate phosphatase-like HAD superfamily hydrolase